MKKRIPFLKGCVLFAILCVVAMSFSLIRQSKTDGKVYEFTIAKKGTMIDNAMCYAWIPEDVGAIRTIIVHQHGCTREGDAAKMMFDLQWRELARKWHAVLLAPKFISGPTQKICANWYNPANGSDPVFFEMLDTLAVRAAHPEIKTVPWTLWGHSGGSMWVTYMTGKYPQRVAVAVAQSCGFDISNSEEALKVPMLHHNGIQDICYMNAGIVERGRKKGALWAHAVNPVVSSAMDGHQCHDLRFLAIPWIDVCLGMRLPEKAGDSQLRAMDLSQSWLADTASKAISPAASFKGDKTAAYWFPNQILAEKWVEYMKTGEVTDKTPPPAPYGLTATYENKNLVLKWNAAPDLESGLKTFIIYRDGKELQTLQYQSKSEFSKVGGYQRWNAGDNPSPFPAPEMAFTDTNVDDKGTHTYQVSTVNWSDGASKKSEKITLKKGKIQ
ncbi:MAG TPA: hypothetical protein VL490_11210 [Mucilaginibacter sp.]|jgi:pimeloyl-ACP methyl ester carboxylesterase|nr:hypothetical protein [Mucilaginibacter sp.]